MRKNSFELNAIFEGNSVCFIQRREYGSELNLSFPLLFAARKGKSRLLAHFVFAWSRNACRTIC